MKIAILIRTLDTSGVARSLINLLNHCEKENLDIDLFLFKKKGALLNLIPRSININILPGNHDIICYSQKQAFDKSVFFGFKRGLCAFWVKYFKINKFVNKMLKKIPNYEGYDVVIAFQDTPNDISLNYGPVEVALTKFPKAKKVRFIHTDFFASGLDNKYVINQLDNFDKIVFVSKSCKKDFDDKLPKLMNKTTYCYNLQDFERIKQLSSQKLNYETFKNEKINLITVARLGEEKAHLRTLKILKKLKEEGYNFSYHIVGEGSMRTAIENFIQSNEMSNYVYLYGNQENPYNFISNSDLFLFLSYHESAGLVIEESYFLNKPVLATNTISAKEFICDENFICENNESSIYDKLKWCLNHLKQKNNDINWGVGECLDNNSKFLNFKKIININNKD